MTSRTTVRGTHVPAGREAQETQAKELPLYPPLLCFQTLNSADCCREKQSSANPVAPFLGQTTQQGPPRPKRGNTEIDLILKSSSYKF